MNAHKLSLTSPSGIFPANNINIVSLNCIPFVSFPFFKKMTFAYFSLWHTLLLLHCFCTMIKAGWHSHLQTSSINLGQGSPNHVRQLVDLLSPPPLYGSSAPYRTTCMTTRWDPLGSFLMMRMSSNKGNYVIKGSVLQGLALQNTMCPSSSKGVSLQPFAKPLVWNYDCFCVRGGGSS